MNKRKLVTDRRPGWQGPYGAVDINEEVSSSEKLNDAIESWIDSLPDVEQQLINANRRVKLLEEGPGGIMEMKQTIANKEAEIEELKRLNVNANKFGETVAASVLNKFYYEGYKIYKLQEALRLIIGNSKLSQVSKEYLAKIAIAALEESK